MQNPMLEVLNYRDSCQLFLSNQTLPPPQLEQILEAGRLSPSAMGIEPWHFIVVTDDDTKTALQHACGGQPQLTSCSTVVVILARTVDLRPGSYYCKEMLQRGFDGAALLENLERRYAHMVEGRDIAAWSTAQCHVAAANMMLAAAAAEIDSCPIWDFNAPAVEHALEVDTARFCIALPIAFGYRAVIPAPKRRRPLEEMVSYR
ncbi:NAD(P)H-dependent oxidoreductase [Chitinimonas naiadis]